MKTRHILLILVIVALLFWRYTLVTRQARRDFVRSVISVGDTRLQVELALTQAQIEQGLGGREIIGTDGMLFVLPERMVPSFWMKGMQFGLDFIWIDGDKVVLLTPDAHPEPGVPDRQLKIYSPNLPVTHVLELPQGSIEKYGLKLGDILDIDTP